MDALDWAHRWSYFLSAAATARTCMSACIWRRAPLQGYIALQDE